MTRSRALGVSALSFSVLVIAHTAAAQLPEEIPISGCNLQMLGNGAEVFWASGFATDDYGFTEGSRSGAIVSGEGDTVEVIVQWSASGPQTESGAIAFGPRGAGFSPGGVGGEAGFNGVVPHLPLADPAQCGSIPKRSVTTTSRLGLQTSHRETQRAPNPEVVEEGHYATGAW